jgi:hypothetical protein
VSSSLNPGEQLGVNGLIKADNGKTHLIMQGDGNLVLYRDDNGAALWSSQTDGKQVTHAVMQDDGNFVAYGDNGDAYWATGTDNHPGSYVALQDDGNLVVYSQNNTALWASATTQSWDPFLADSGDVHIGTGHWMHTTGSMASTGLISARTRTWCTIDLTGFHGSVVAVLLDGAGKAIWPPNPQETKHQFGVDGVWVGTHDRTDAWANQADPAVLAQAKSLGFIHFPDPKNMLLTDIPIAAKTVAEIVVAILAVVG